MSPKELLTYCLEKDGAYIDYPFGDDYPVVKLKSSNGKKTRIFAEFYNLDGRDIMTFSTDADTALTLRMEYPDVIIKGWHAPPVQAKYKSSVFISQMLDSMLKDFIDISYERAKNKTN